VLKSGCYDTHAAPGSGVCWEARRGACGWYVEENSIDSGRHEAQDNGARDSTERVERVREATCADSTGNCEASACNVQIGDKLYCSQCKTGFVPINGQCTAKAGAIDKCKNAADSEAGDRTCGKCLGTTFMYKGGCYQTGQQPGQTMCKTAQDGVCTEAADGNAYFVPPNADASHDSVVACNDTTEITLTDGKKYVGVANCLTCTKPANGNTNTPTAATCTKCVDGYFGAACTKCHESCLTCSTAGESGCTACAEGTHFLGAAGNGPGKCVSCGTVQSTWSGVANCAKCTKPVNENTPAVCTECADSYYLKTATGATPPSCVGASECGKGLFPTTVSNIKTCISCSTTANGGITDCSECSLLPSASRSSTTLITCTKCTGKKLSPLKDACLTACPAGTYDDNNVCKSCNTIAGCSTCSSGTVCTKCETGKIVKTADGATSCIDESACNNGFFVKEQDGSKTCEACDSTCKTCSGAAAQCTSCKTDTPYLKKTDTSQTGTCVDANGCSSDNTYYADDTVDPTSGKLCRKCAEGGVTVCTTCEKIESGVVCKECTGETAIFGLNKKSCVKECPENSSKQNDTCVCNDGFTPNADSSACVAASSCRTPHCQTCTGEGQEGEACTACATGYYLTPTGQCVDKCDKLGGYYADNNVCKPCSPECASCSTAGANKCLSCPAGKVLKYTDDTKPNDGGSCVDECKTNTGGCETCGAVIGGSKYCSKCGDASQAPLNGNCAANTARTKFCTNASNGACTQCANNYFLLDGGCYETSRQPGSQVCTTADSNGQCSQCANTLSPNDGVCPACPAGCSKCSGNSGSQTCSACLTGYYLSTNTCVKCDTDDNTIKGVPDCVSCTAPASSGTVTCYVTQTSTVDPTDPSVNKGGLSSGAIAGISVAAVVVVGGLVGFLCWWFICRGKA
ncbi:Variant-specific surface protein, partial [Giardia duodenalis]